MRKLVYVLAATAVLGAATPASAQFLFVGDRGFGFGIGADPWWGGPAYRSAGLWGSPAYRSGWWGGPGYRSTAWWGEPAWGWGRPVRSAWWGGPVRSTAWWGGPAFGSTATSAFAFAGDCRTVSVRRHLADGRTVIRRSRVC